MASSPKDLVQRKHHYAIVDEVDSVLIDDARDSEWMGPMYQFHGLTVDCIDRHQPNSDARRKAYMADITFGTCLLYTSDDLEKTRTL